jgi:putative endonuclease
VGELIARRYLEDRGLTVLASNVVVPEGEIDLIALDGRSRVAVEVRSRVGGGDPVDAADDRKRFHASRLAAAAGAHRFDVVGVRLGREGVDVHWVPGAF